MNISFGVITRHFTTMEPIDQFLDNAEKFGHDIYSVVVAYAEECDESVVKALESRINVQLVRINETDEMCQTLHEIGMTRHSIDTLLNCPELPQKGLVPYGKNRNNVIMKAMLTGSDVLVFIDTDVYPELLVETDGGVVSREIDFIGEHLKYLELEKVMITTSDYSGYYIIPPMSFEGMEKLYRGLQKENVCDFLVNSDQHKGFVPARYGQDRVPFRTNKILGGNVAIKLSIFEKVLPFFSSVYDVGGHSVLTRGEDTLLGLELERSKDLICMDIDLRIFHNTFSHYPTVPDVVNDQNIKDRFYRACLGWIGRNPFLNWMNGVNLDKIHELQRKALVEGAPAVAKYLNDDRFLVLPEALDLSYNRVEDMVQEYHRFARSWKEFIAKYKNWRYRFENTHYEPLSIGRVRQRHLHDEFGQGAEFSGTHGESGVSGTQGNDL